MKRLLSYWKAYFYVMAVFLMVLFPVLSLLPVSTEAATIPQITLHSGNMTPANGATVIASASENTYSIQFRTTATNISPVDRLKTQVFYKLASDVNWKNFGTTSVLGPDGKMTTPNNVRSNYLDSLGRNCEMAWGSTVKPASCNSYYTASNGTVGRPAFSGYPTYTPTVKLKPGNYEWTARAFAAGVYGQFASSWKFQINDNPDYVQKIKTVVSLEFDDGLISQSTAQSILDAHSMKGTFYVSSSRVGGSGYLSKDQMLAMQANGHEIGAHTVNHVDLTTLSATQLDYQIGTDKTNLEAMGFDIDNLAYPFGSYNSAVQTTLKKYGFDTGRVVGGIQCNGCRTAETIPPLDAYATETPSSIKNTTTLAMMQDYVIKAENGGGGWVQIVMHDVSNSGGSYTVSPATLTAFLDWLSTRTSQGTAVKTVRGAMGTTFTPPTPPPAPNPSNNLLKNASLENDFNGDNAPDDWDLKGWGTSTYVYSRIADAHSGSWAEKLEITSFTSGDRKIVSEQDNVNMAAFPVATPGKTYTASAWFKSSIPVALSFYFRNTAGSWVWFAESVFVPANANWTQVSWNTPALPADAQYVSVGIQAENVGWVIADDFSLTVN